MRGVRSPCGEEREQFRLEETEEAGCGRWLLFKPSFGDVAGRPHTDPNPLLKEERGFTAGKIKKEKGQKRSGKKV